MTKLEKKAERLAEIMALQNALKVEADGLKAELMAEMVKSNTKKFATEHISITFVDATEKVTFDSAKFKTEHPRMYKDFLKTSKVSEYIKTALNKA